MLGAASRAARGLDGVLLGLFLGRRLALLLSLRLVRGGRILGGALPLLVHAFLANRLAAGDVARGLLPAPEQLVEESHVVPPLVGKARAYRPRRRESPRRRPRLEIRTPVRMYRRRMRVGERREPSAPVQLLHVTNGESAGSTLRQTGIGGAVLSWQDVLHEGPVPAGPRPALLRARARFLSGCGWGGTAAILASLERRDRQLLGALRGGVEVVLWFEHDLYDQLQLLDALSLAHEANAAPELLVVGSFPGKASFGGLGELSADELETLWPQRRTAAPETLAAAASAWEAIRAPEPVALAEWASRETPGLPYLAPALTRLLEELPAPSDGLSGTERRALQAVAEGAATPVAAFAAYQRLEPAPFLGDAWFFRTLAGLPGLVETPEGPLPAP